MEILMPGPYQNCVTSESRLSLYFLRRLMLVTSRSLSTLRLVSSTFPANILEEISPDTFIFCYNFPLRFPWR